MGADAVLDDVGYATLVTAVGQLDPRKTSLVAEGNHDPELGVRQRSSKGPKVCWQNCEQELANGNVEPQSWLRKCKPTFTKVDFPRNTDLLVRILQY